MVGGQAVTTGSFDKWQRVNEINLNYQLPTKKISNIRYNRLVSSYRIIFFIYQNCQAREKQVLQKCVRETMNYVRAKVLFSNIYGKIFCLFSYRDRT